MADALNFRRSFDGTAPDISLAEQKAAGAHLAELVNSLAPHPWISLIALQKWQADTLLGFLPTNQPERGVVALNVASFVCHEAVTVAPICAYYLDGDDSARRFDYPDSYLVKFADDGASMEYPHLWSSNSNDLVRPSQVRYLNDQSEDGVPNLEGLPLLDSGPVDQAEIIGLETLVKADNTRLTFVNRLRTFIDLRHLL